MLVSPRWYDDGPEDLAGQFRMLEDESTLRRSLAEIDPAKLVEELERELAPLPLNELTLPLVLALSEIESRPSLVLPLLPLLEAVPELPAPSLVRALRFACAAGGRDRVSKALVQRLNADFLKAMQLPEMKKRMAEFGLQPVGNSPDEFDKLILAELDKWARVTKAANIKVD